MTILAVAGEEEYTEYGSSPLGRSAVTTAGRYRSTARMAYEYYPATANRYTSWARLYYNAVGFDDMWVTWRENAAVASGNTGYMLMGFGSGGYKRVGIYVAVSGKLKIATSDEANTITDLDTESASYSANVLYKYDMQVSSFNSASGTINVWRSDDDGGNRELILTYTGDLRTNGVTILDEVMLQGRIASAGYGYYSEVIVSTTNTWGMGLVTLEPTADGNTMGWTGAYTDIDETTINDADLISSLTDGQIGQFAYQTSRIGTPSAILGVYVSARAQAGSSITNLTPNFRVASTDYYDTAIAQTAGFKPIGNLWTQNPNTTSAWTYTELTTAGVNYGFRANT